MTDDRFEQLVESLKERFDDVELATEDLYVDTGEEQVKRGTQDVLEFSMDLGEGSEQYQIVRENKPIVKNKTTHYAKRASDVAQTEYEFSDTEFSHKIFVYKEDFDTGEWQAITAEMLGIE